VNRDDCKFDFAYGRIESLAVKRWLRWVFNSLVILSALFCVGTAAVWVRHTSESRTTWGGWGKIPQPSFKWILDDDGVWLAYYCRPATVVSQPTMRTEISGLGFWYAHIFGLLNLNEESFHLIARYRSLLAVESTLPICWLCAVIWRKKQTPKIGTCATCGYDLRATPDRCPECGMVPTGVKA
jgi:hypothetical protein